MHMSKLLRLLVFDARLDRHYSLDQVKTFIRYPLYIESQTHIKRIEGWWKGDTLHMVVGMVIGTVYEKSIWEFSFVHDNLKLI